MCVDLDGFVYASDCNRNQIYVYYFVLLNY